VIEEVSFEAPSNLTRIRRHGFWMCETLTSLTFPSLLTVMEKDSVSYCMFLKSVTFESGSVPVQMNPDPFAFDSWIILD
jgi:hypothetical protein